MNELKGKYAVITGAAGGIGAATAETFAREGAAGIVMADMDGGRAREAGKRIESGWDCKCMAVKTDISSASAIKNLFFESVKQFGTVDILVNCAGICPVGSIEEIGEAEWDRVMDINLRGTYLCSREALAIMKEKLSGKIVNLSSISGRIGGIATGINYATSKGGILTLTMSLAKAAGPYNINVNGVAPGFIDTEMTKNFTHFKVETVPLGRIGKPDDVADVILFLSSDRSRYVTGVTIDVNGGVFMA
ncbi:MAG: SDR family oxidoreductase [Ruminiclostridium sp.]|nr:SDR family oxidoreductase [Ruminiclostridium sp.]